MKTARQVLNDTSHSMVPITPGASVFEALEVMSDRHVGALLVMKEGHLIGVMSERDYARKVALMNRSSRDTRVDEIMTDRVVCVAAERTVDECMALMTQRDIRHLPVLDGDTLLGMLSMRDLVEETISDQRFTIDQLEVYIRG
jgi:CBS domain-containing protein